MIKNYLNVALRNIKRNFLSSFLNITGLAIGMACAILLLLWVRNEVSYDRFHKNAGNLYRVTSNSQYAGRFHREAGTPFPLAAALKTEYPEIIRSTRYHNMPITFIKGEDKINGNCAFIDHDFFKMFDIDFIRGDKSTVLTKPYEILLTEDMAFRYFGEEDALGKQITRWPDEVFTVTGIIKDLPRNSHFYYDCIVSNELYSTHYGKVNADSLYGWQGVFNYTFVELLESADSKQVGEKIRDLIQRKRDGSNTEIYLQNIRDIHLNSGKYEGDIAYGNIEQVKLAGMVAILILIVACINFMNLLTAQSSARAREIGIRKVAGASRQKIIVQFFGESLLIVFIAHIIAMILVELMLPGFNSFLRTKLEVDYLSTGLYAGLSLVVIFCALLGGSYPAFHLSALKPMTTLRGTTGENPGRINLRKILIIIQFTLSFMFIVSSMIVRKQLNFIFKTDLGQNIENTGYFEIPDRMDPQTLKNELGNEPDILNTTIAFTNVQSIINHQLSTGLRKDGDTVFLNGLMADTNYSETFQLKMREGKFLTENDYAANENRSINVVINEKAKEFLGIQGTGEEVTSVSGRNLKIVGIVKDFHYRSMRSFIEPLIIFPVQSGLKGRCYVRFKPDRISFATASVGSRLKALNPDYNIEIKFLEDDLKNMYFAERAAAIILGYITILAIVISCLGLFGLSSFMIVRRTKEIGIRKTNGARSGEISVMFSKEYIKLILISFIIACPLALYATNIWLRGYAYRTNAGLPEFAVAAIIVTLIALMTVGFQIYKAANKNPVEALRYE